ncbi:MAG: bifunctional serine/threonine-protein kinase/formylglycine-generating enzyme family protein [Planctomycetota bacterium]
MPDESKKNASKPFGGSPELRAICERFVQELQNGGEPRLEGFLPDEGEPLYAQRGECLRQLLRIELTNRLERGELIHPPSYQNRFPEFDQVVREELTFHSAITMEAHSEVGTERHDTFETEVYSGHDDESRGKEQHDSAAGGSDATRQSGSLVFPKLERYEAIRRLGQGGFGTVFLARDLRLDREVAIKVCHGPSSDFGRKEAMIREARAAAKLKHPNIVCVYDVQEDDGNPFIVMEYVAGQTLDQWKDSSGSDWQSRLDLFRKIVAAIGYVHREGMFHRDLKPANIIVDASGEPHVTDFGLALMDGARRLRIGERSGTARYMSPEQVQGSTNLIDGRSDVWSLGVILYELLCDRPPFQAKTTSDLFGQILEVTQVPVRQINPDVPVEVQSVCDRCLRKEVDQRYSSAQDMLDELDGILKPKRKPWITRQAMTRLAVAVTIGAILLTLIPSSYFVDLCTRDEVWARRMAPVIARYPFDGVNKGLIKKVHEADQEFESDTASLLAGKRSALARLGLIQRGDFDSGLDRLVGKSSQSVDELFQLWKQSGQLNQRQKFDLFDHVLNQREVSPDDDSSAAAYWVILAMGGVGPDEVGSVEGRSASWKSRIERLAKLYEQDPSARVHSAAGWLLRRLDQQEMVDRVDRMELGYSPNREWFNVNVKDRSFTFIVIPAGEYEVGSIWGIDEEDAGWGRRTITLSRTIAIMDREVTFHDIVLSDRNFASKAFTRMHLDVKKYSDQHPANPVTWYQAVRFCRWLCSETGAPQPYVTIGKQEDVEFDENPRQPWPKGGPRNWPVIFSRAGFRLPTQSEWEVACRGTYRNSNSFGNDPTISDAFAWTSKNSDAALSLGRLLRPNLAGLYGMEGGLSEWCHDWFASDVADSDDLDPIGPAEALSADAGRVCRGGNYKEPLLESTFRFEMRPLQQNIVIGCRAVYVIPEIDNEDDSAEN